MGILENRVAIITGASSGVGRGVAKILAKEGAKVCICARRMNMLDEAADEIRKDGGEATAVTCDVTDWAQIKNVVDVCVKTYGGVDILVNVAQGAMEFRSLGDLDADYAMLAYKSGPLASLAFMKECFPYLKASGHGRIINTASPAGYDGNSGYGAYGMAKEAIRALTRTAANEWGQYGITVNVFLPLIATETYIEKYPEVLKKLQDKSPIRRVGTVDKDCGPFLAFLASDEGSYLTGQSFMLDGGIHMHS
ncbi:MAG: SDR family oxidoreductase [Clostridiales bacterium]